MLFAGDLRAVEAKYHQACMQKFLKTRCVAQPESVNIRNLDKLNEKGFLKLCDWLEGGEQQDRQFTLNDLRAQLATYLPVDIPAYSTRHLKRKLREYFKERLSVAEIDGKNNDLSLKAKTASILHDYFNISQDDEHLRLAKESGQAINTCLKRIKHNPVVYPSPDDIDFAKLEACVPEILWQLITSMFNESRTNSAKQKKKLLQISLCHIIMQAAGNQSYISPLLLSVGLFIHQTTRSGVFLDVLSSLGLSASYSQVMAFERSAVVSESIYDLPPGIAEKCKGGGFCQWVAYNFDYNEDTLTGHDTTHVMGLITCQSPPSKDQRTVEIPQMKVSAKAIVQAGIFF